VYFINVMSSPNYLVHVWTGHFDINDATAARAQEMVVQVFVQVVA
jgi:hypothetical protein